MAEEAMLFTNKPVTPEKKKVTFAINIFEAEKDTEDVRPGLIIALVICIPVLIGAAV